MTEAIGDYVIHDPRFSDVILGSHVHVERLWTGGRWCEGPVWFGDAGHLLWSDIPNNRMMRWTGDGHVSVFRQPSDYANGSTRDRQGRLVTCEHGSRRVTRTETDGTVRVIADNYRGKQLNSPNDVVVKSDGTIWFTDPDYGILSDYEGHRSERELDGCYVFRVDPRDGAISIVADDFSRPNGLAFSVDERFLYIADTGRSHDPDGPAHIRKFAVAENKLTDAGVFAAPDAGMADGFRVDEKGNIWTSAANGIHCFDPDGNLLGRIHIPEIVSNCVFGGAKRNRLFITATTSLYSVHLNTRGAAPH